MGLGRGWARVQRFFRPVPGLRRDRRFSQRWRTGLLSCALRAGLHGNGRGPRRKAGETSMSHCFDCALLIVRNLTKSGAKKVRQDCLTSPPIAVGGGEACLPPLISYYGTGVSAWRVGEGGWILLGYCWR